MRAPHICMLICAELHVVEASGAGGANFLSIEMGLDEPLGHGEVCSSAVLRNSN